MLAPNMPRSCSGERFHLSGVLRRTVQLNVVLVLLQATTVVLDVVDNDVELTYTPAVAAITLSYSSAMQVEVAYHIRPSRVKRGSQERGRKG